MQHLLVLIYLINTFYKNCKNICFFFKESDDEDDFDAKWSKLDEAHEQQLANEFDETNIKRDDSLYDDIIEEDPNNYDEEPFDPTVSLKLNF